VNGLARVSAATAGLVTGEGDQFLEFLWDGFHEPRRADLGGYGPFTSGELSALKERLYRDRGIVMTVSGAGPSMLFLYNRARRRRSIGQRGGGRTWAGRWVQEVERFFHGFGVELTVGSTAVATKGGYDSLVEHYGVGVTPVDRLRRTRDG